MRTTERLTKFAQWTYETVCKGRQMKTPAPGMDFTQIVKQEPSVYIGYYPMRLDESGWQQMDEVNVAPGILIMPTHSYVKYTEEKRFDRYNHVSRPQALGQGLNLQVLFSVYEDGVRMPGFIRKWEKDQEFDLTLVREGTQDGLYTLLNWMDDFKTALLGQKMIPHTDLFLDEASMTYGLYSDQKYINDKRPLFYGFVNLGFQCYAEEGQNREIDKFLD